MSVVEHCTAPVCNAGPTPRLRGEPLHADDVRLLQWAMAAAGARWERGWPMRPRLGFVGFSWRKA